MEQSTSRKKRKRNRSEPVSATSRKKRILVDDVDDVDGVDEDLHTVHAGMDEKIDAEYSGMIEPPLIKQLKRILSEYPDNGQIIKELLQNAEDARASEVQIIYDERNINNEYDDANWFTKFFKGPALCVTNNAKFTDKDWKGIKMIASSVKEDNKLKVGRFGMGFKSVFHMTDCPCIISGDRILLIDPSGPSNKINAEMKLRQLCRYKGMDTKAFFRAFSETVSIKEDIFETGHYNGTVFWFPLRKEKSTISPTIYDREKTMSLFMSFVNDASESLLFLCHVVRVSVKMKNETTHELENIAIASVDVEDSVISKRKNFIEQIEQTKTMDHEPLACCYNMTMTILRNEETNKTEWMIMHYYMGKKASETLIDLVLDPDLGLCPCVGLALPINTKAMDQFDSRIFCFLPLPKESSIQTGLPVHVNGFFALNQSRHHLKWSTEDQKDQTITDKDIQWNQALIDECLTEAYKELLRTIILRSDTDGNSKESVKLIYRLIPNETEVVEKWKRIPMHLKSFLQTLPFLFSYPLRKFVTTEVAQFAMFTGISYEVGSVTGELIETITELSVPYVSLERKTFEKLAFYSRDKPNDLTPDKLAAILKDNVEILREFTTVRKYAILEYLLSERSYSCLSGLPLIPVSSGDWKMFGESTTVYLCRSVEVGDLFPSYKACIVSKTSDMSGCTWEHFEIIAASEGLFQLKLLKPPNLKMFLVETLNQKVGPSYAIRNQQTYAWFTTIWRFLDQDTQHLEISEMKGIKLIPETTFNTHENSGEVKLHPIESYFLETTKDMQSELLLCFKSLGVTVIQKLPPWIPKLKMTDHIFSSTEDSIRKLLKVISCSPNRDRIQEAFNISLDANSKDAFVKYVCDIGVVDQHTVDMLTGLKMFQQHSVNTSVKKHISVCNSPFYVRTDIPVELPSPYIKASTDTLPLLLRLGATEQESGYLVEIILRQIAKESFYQQSECDKFMGYFLNMFSHFEDRYTVKELAKNIPFLKNDSGLAKLPRELFDQGNSLLRDLFIEEQDKFHCKNEFQTDKCKTALKCLGLKGIEDVTADDILSTALLLHDWALSIEKENFCSIKSSAMMKYLINHSSVLQQTINSKLLVDILKGLRCIKPIKDLRYQPPALPLYATSQTLCKPCDAILVNGKNEYLVGATMPLLPQKFQCLEKEFGWNAYPPVEKVIEQLVLIKKIYVIEQKSYILPLLEKIYNFLSDCTTLPTSFKAESLVWTGEMFESPANIIIKLKPTDLDKLEPYFFTLPLEFEKYADWFENIGCHGNQTVDVLTQVIEKIQKKHIKRQTDDEYERDRQLTVQVVNKLAERFGELHGHDILLPVQQKHTNRMEFLHASKCTADKTVSKYEPIEGDDSIVFVHDTINVDVAKVLGAKSLSKQILAGTESLGIESFGQKERLTDRLRKLIEEGYKDGLSVPKELIQNADDAGATAVKFLFDERQHSDARTSLFSSEMAQCQGPSIFVYNDASFSNSDFENITKLNGATKECESDKIGRFGLGFCAVYNLTDVPSFVSKSSFVMFDPHKTYLSNFVDADSPGIKIDFSKTENFKLLKIYKDQFKPFQNIFGFEIPSLVGTGLDGTLFRFPLRTHDQANRSEISSDSYDRKKVEELLQMFEEGVNNMLLFTQNVTQIEFHHIPRKSKSNQAEPILLFKATKSYYTQDPNQVQGSNRQTVLRTVSDSLKRQEHFKEMHKIHIKVEVFGGIDGSILSRSTQKGRKIDIPWIVFWETGHGEALGLANKIATKGVLPLSAVAIPCDSSFTKPITQQESIPGGGRLFCFLPLPIKTNLNMHINCPFDITSDRQRLVTLTDDDKASLGCKWNESLLTNASVNAIFSLLEFFTKSDSESHFYKLWPIECLPAVNVFHQSFFKRIIIEDKRLFYGQGKFVPFSELVFLDPEIREDPEVDDAGFQMLLNIGTFGLNKILVDIPSHLVNVLKKHNNDEIISNCCIGKTQFLETILGNVKHDYWKTHESDYIRLLVYCLNSDNERIKIIIKQCQCIPVQPDGVLKTPCRVVEENGDVAKLFKTEDAVFPVAALLEKGVREKLVQLGMITDVLPDDIFVDRCTTIESIARQGRVECALKRCRNIMQYIKKQTEQGIAINHNVISKLKDIYILPVLEKPAEWLFSWHADTDDSLVRCYTSGKDQRSMLFGRPSSLFSANMCNIGASVANIVDINALKGLHLSEDILLGLGVRNNIESDIVIRHMCKVSSEYVDSDDKMYVLLDRILKASYQILQDRIKNEEDSTTVRAQLAELNDKAVVLIDKKIFPPEQVAFHMKYECPPHLHKLPTREAFIYEDVFKEMGVRQMFTLNDFVKVLKDEKQKWQGIVCRNLEGIIRLLYNVNECCDTQTVLQSIKNDIVAPDISGKLYPMHELVIADDQFQTSIKMHIVHKSISHQLAEQLGAKHKKQKCFDSISIGIPFGQKEKLVSRLGGLLQAYPCDSGIMKELLQNADDAEATEINFIKDYRNHPTEHIFDESCSKLQSPSLCVYNDKHFTEDDLRGIQDLGEGSKRNDPTKTGQYGVGFNAVYHLTDIPSFLTKGPEHPENGLLCIFDPTCKHIPGVQLDVPGRQFNASDVKENYPDVLAGYLETENLFNNSIGTLFRFPLRTEKSEISKGIHSPQTIDLLLNEMSTDMFDALLFVKHVQSIRISNVSGGQIREEYCIKAEISEQDSLKRMQFFNDVKELSKIIKSEKCRIHDTMTREIGYDVTLKDSKGREERFYVVQRFGFGDSVMSENLFNEYCQGNLGCLPFAGVAFRTEIPSCQRESKAFCFLPLPGETKLPVHINGHFALDHESRRELWGDGYRKEWNEHIVNRIIVPAYIQCIGHWKSVISNHARTMKDLGILTTMYHKIFPTYHDVENKYWKLLISKLFREITNERLALFPVVHNNQTLEWVPLGMPKDINCGYINTLDKRNHEKSLAIILKGIGMKIVQTPLSVKRSIENSGTTGLVCTFPNETVSFIASFRNEGSHCTIGQLDTDISKTKLKNKNNLQILLHFIGQSENFVKQLPNLPVLLTDDNVLRVYCRSRPVYNSEFCFMFPHSGDKFIHRSLIHDCEMYKHLDALGQFGYLKALTLQEFIELIPSKYMLELKCNSHFLHWDTGNSNFPTVKWIKLLWKFVYRVSTTEKRWNNINYFQNCVVQLQEWCFLPAIRESSKMLFQIERACMLIDIDSFYSVRDLQMILAKLSLPTLDRSLFESKDEAERQTEVVDTYRQIVQLITNNGHPKRLLECLYLWTQIKGLQWITDCLDGIKDAISVLKYFSIIVNEACSKDIVQKLKTLPLFVTHRNTIVPLCTGKTFYVVPDKLPLAGLDKLQNIVFLKDISALRELYSFLDVHEGNVASLYADQILPNMNLIQQDSWIQHVEYIKDNDLFVNQQDPFKKKIRYALQVMEFIKTDKGFKKCSDFYFNGNKVFLTMCCKDQLFPERFRTASWRNLFTDLGMPMDVTDGMLLTFAEQIEASPYHDRHRENKSGVLTDCFLNNIEKWKIDTLNRIKQIRFIVPAQLPELCKAIYPKKKESRSQLICINGSVERRFINLCWSTFNVLPFDIQQNQRVLGIQSLPTQSGVIKHIQNISTEIERKINDLDKEDLKEMMDTIYKHLKYHGSICDPERSMLESFPIIHLPTENKMVCVNDIAIEVSKEVELKPYFFQPPLEYYDFFRLFAELGVSDRLKWYHCMNILFKLQLHTKQEEMIPQELTTVKEVLVRFNAVLIRDKDKLEKKANRKLYLPNKQKVMCESTDLVVSNNGRLEERMRSVELNYFIGFRELSLTDLDVEIFVMTLPVEVRPKLLTNIVTERFEKNKIVVASGSLLASRLSRFIHSSEYIVGLCRIAKKFVEKKNENFDLNRDVSKIKKTVLCIRVKEVTQLETILEYKGDSVPGTSDSRACFHDEEGESEQKIVNFYFKIKEAQPDSFMDAICSSEGLSRLMVQMIGLPFEAEVTVVSLLRKYEDPGKISRLLDDERYPSLDIESGLNSLSAFPKPGTYVEEKFHAFLEQSLSLFEEHEYLHVALELSNSNMDDVTDEKAVYIYVHIISEIITPGKPQTIFNTFYSVDVGQEEIQKVPAYRLYRFVRTQTTTNEVTVFVGNTPEQYLPFDENSRRIEAVLREAWTLPEVDRRRIIRRLLLRWHPDKNRGSEKYAKRIFDFIKELIVRFVKAEQSNVQHGRTYRSRYQSMFNDIGKRAKSYARCYYGNICDYNRCYDTGNYSHGSAKRAVVKDEYEAKRWMKQAKYDFQAASTFIVQSEDVKAFNWICYTCHQASEKALKAACFAKNANEVVRRNHSLSQPALSLSNADVVRLAGEMENLVGNHTRMRYPDAMERATVPSDLFTKENAEKALDIAKQIIKITDDLI